MKNTQNAPDILIKGTLNTLVWLQSNQLNPHHDIFNKVDDADAVLFIWDETLFEKGFFSKQRLYFIWQCLQDFKDRPMLVIKGETHEVLTNLYELHPQLKIVTPENPCFNYDRWRFVEKLKQNQLIIYDGKMPFGFFKFWKAAEQQLFGNPKVSGIAQKSMGMR